MAEGFQLGLLPTLLIVFFVAIIMIALSASILTQVQSGVATAANSAGTREHTNLNMSSGSAQLTGQVCTHIVRVTFNP